MNIEFEVLARENIFSVWEFNILNMGCCFSAIPHHIPATPKPPFGEIKCGLYLQSNDDEKDLHCVLFYKKEQIYIKTYKGLNKY